MSIHLTILLLGVVTIFILMVFSYWLVSGIVLILLIILMIRSKKIIPFIIILLAIIPMYLSMERPWNKVNNETNHIGVVLKSDNNNLVVKQDDGIYYVSTKTLVNQGDKISFACNYSVPNDVGFQHYINSKYATESCFAYDLEIIEHNLTNRNDLFNTVISSPTLYGEYASYLFYGYESLNNQEIIDTSNDLGISHIFVVSGFHIGLIFIVLDKLIKKLTKSKGLSFIISFLTSLFFLFIIFNPATGIRALGFRTILFINEKKSLGLSRYDCLSMIGILMFLINPFLMISISMFLSYGITFMILLIVNKSNSLFTKITIPFAAFCFATPVILSFNTSFNALSPIDTFILSPIMLVVFPIMLITLPLSGLWQSLDFLFIALSSLLTWFTNWAIYHEVANVNKWILLSLPFMTYALTDLYIEDKFLYTITLTFNVMLLSLI